MCGSNKTSKNQTVSYTAKWIQLKLAGDIDIQTDMKPSHEVKNKLVLLTSRFIYSVHLKVIINVI